VCALQSSFIPFFGPAATDFFLNRELKAISTQAVPVLPYILIVLTHVKN
jgi:hypothetical protein